jgi:hypothetical protein
MGSVDLLAEAPGVTDFEQLWSRAQEMRLFGLQVRVASIEGAKWLDSYSSQLL